MTSSDHDRTRNTLVSTGQIRRSPQWARPTAKTPYSLSKDLSVAFIFQSISPHRRRLVMTCASTFTRNRMNCNIKMSQRKHGKGESTDGLKVSRQSQHRIKEVH